MCVKFTRTLKMTNRFKEISIALALLNFESKLPHRTTAKFKANQPQGSAWLDQKIAPQNFTAPRLPLNLSRTITLRDRGSRLSQASSRYEILKASRCAKTSANLKWRNRSVHATNAACPQVADRNPYSVSALCYDVWKLIHHAAAFDRAYRSARKLLAEKRRIARFGLI